jgi:hypothetical protein
MDSDEPDTNEDEATTSDQEQQSTEITTYGLDLIAQAANNVEERLDSGVDEYTAYAASIEKIIDIFAAETFLEWMAFTHEVCETYDVADEYPSEQRVEAVYGSDWREGVRMGFWHILEGAIEQQVENPQDIDIPQPNSETDTEAPDIDPEEWADTRTEEDMEPDLILERTLTQTVTMPDRDAVFQELNSDEDSREFEFMQYIVLLDQLTEEYDLQTWEGISDTMVREGISYGHFCWNIVDTILSEFAMNIDDINHLNDNNTNTQN